MIKIIFFSHFLLILVLVTTPCLAASRKESEKKNIIKNTDKVIPPAENLPSQPKRTSKISDAINNKKIDSSKKSSLKEETNKESLKGPYFTQKENPKKLYSYTWKSERKKIFEQPEKWPYNTSTTKFITFGTLKNSIRYKYTFVKSLDVRSIHRWTLNQKYGNTLQDFGVDATPAINIYFEMPKNIGTTSGYENFDLYFKDAYQIKLYDTKSPFTYIYAIPGKNISKIVFEYSQNLNENWNIGGTFSNTSMGCPFEKYTKSRYALNRLWDLHLHYNDDSSKYDLVLTLSGMKSYCHMYYPWGEEKDYLTFDKQSKKQQYQLITFPNIDLEYKKNGKPKFINVPISGEQSPNAKNKTCRHIINVYNQYEIFEQKKIYYQVSLLYDKNNLGERDSDELETDRSEITPFRSTNIVGIDNEVGFKGLYGQNIFYRIYIKRSDLFRNYPHLSLDKKDEQYLHVGENFIGTHLVYNFRNGSYADCELEYLVPYHYRVSTSYKSDRLELSLGLSRKKNPFIFDKFYAYVDVNNNSAEPIEVDKKKIEYSFPFANKAYAGFIIYKSKSLILKPTVMALSIGKTIKECNVYLCPGAEINFRTGKIHVDNKIIGSFAAVDKFSSYIMPPVLINSSIYYLTSLYQKKLQMCTGIDVNFRWKYNAMPFASSNTSDRKNFYIFQPKDGIRNESYGLPVINVFLNFVYQNLGLFFKITNITDGFLGSHFTTNRYPIQRRSYDLGISWKFFN